MEVPKLIRIKSFEDLEDELKKLGIGKKLTVITGPTYTKRFAENIRKYIKEYEFFFQPIGTNFDPEALKKVLMTDAILAIGGGMPIDVAKDVADKTEKPLVVFPTAPSHDGISSPNVTLATQDRPYSRVVDIKLLAVLYHLPTLCFADYRAIKAGIGDMIGKITACTDLFMGLENQRCNEEVLKSAGKDEIKKVAHEYFIPGAKKVIEEINRFEEEGWRDISSWRESDSYKSFVFSLFERLFYSGVGMCKLRSSIGASGSEHNVAHATPGDARHGEKVAVATISMLYLQEKYLGKEEIFGIDWQTLRRKLSSVGVPTTAKELNISDYQMIQAIPRALEIGRMRKRYTILDYVDEKFTPVNNHFAYSLLKETEII